MFTLNTQLFYPGVQKNFLNSFIKEKKLYNKLHTLIVFNIMSFNMLHPWLITTIKMMNISITPKVFFWLPLSPISINYHPQSLGNHWCAITIDKLDFIDFYKNEIIQYILSSSNFLHKIIILRFIHAAVCIINSRTVFLRSSWYMLLNDLNGTYFIFPDDYMKEDKQCIRRKGHKYFPNSLQCRISDPISFTISI